MKSKRRSFIKKAALGSGMLIMGTGRGKSERQVIHKEIESTPKKVSWNDHIRLGLIGCGIQGFSNARAAVQVPGVSIAAACDLYDGRMMRAQELYGKDIFTSRDFREMITRDDIDAVCISTTDHWHDYILKEALKAGKPVYCEKPMMHRIEEGHDMIQAEKESGLPVQIGSQRASSVTTHKAKELFESGAIGTLMVADIVYDRNNSNGAWQYSIPTDASPETLDWDAFLGDAPHRPFDKMRFFRWRNYADYGTGVAGDLFVHLFTALHIITSSIGPEKIYATGGLRFWKDGRDAPDITLGLYDYAACDSHPAFNVQMRVNFVDGSGGGSHVKLIGSEGVMTINWNGVTVVKNPVSTHPTYGGWDSFATFASEQQKEYKEWFKKEYGNKAHKKSKPTEVEFTEPKGYSDHVDHWAGFVDAIKNGTPLLENTTFGMRAAGPSLASNISMETGMPVIWDPVDMKIIK